MPRGGGTDTWDGCGDGGGGGGGNGGGGGGDGDVGVMSTDGVDVSLVSEMGSGEWASAMSLVDLAMAVVDGVGPEAAGDVLAACPQLLDNLPPEVRALIADSPKVFLAGHLVT